MSQTNVVPDFTNYGYQIINKLGENKELSSITWQGIKIEQKLPVVIKQFRFATQNSNWVGYQVYQQESQFLQQLEHSGIPKYLGQFENENSFCFVREYIPGISLLELTEVSEKVIKKIAFKILQIIDYLQQQQPPIIYINLTADNILVDQQFNPFLIDFSAAKTLQTSKNNSDISEQLNATGKALDVYTLGCTLNSLMAQQSSLKLLSDFSHETEIDNGFQEWLNTMTASEIIERYPDAETALKALKNNSWEEIDVVNQSSDYVPLSQPAFIVGLGTITILGSAIAIGFKVTQEVTEKSLVNIMIAFMAMIVIYLTQSASLTLVTNDNTEKKQGFALAISVPIILAMITGFIFGRGEAVAISLVTIFAQTIILASVLLQKLSWKQANNIVKIVICFIAIALGGFFGTVIF